MESASSRPPGATSDGHTTGRLCANTHDTSEAPANPESHRGLGALLPPPPPTESPGAGAAGGGEAGPPKHAHCRTLGATWPKTWLLPPPRQPPARGPHPSRSPSRPLFGCAPLRTHTHTRGRTPRGPSHRRVHRLTSRRTPVHVEVLKSDIGRRRPHAVSQVQTPLSPRLLSLRPGVSVARHGAAWQVVTST